MRIRELVRLTAGVGSFEEVVEYDSTCWLCNKVRLLRFPSSLDLFIMTRIVLCRESSLVRVRSMPPFRRPCRTWKGRREAADGAHQVGSRV